MQADAIAEKLGDFEGEFPQTCKTVAAVAANRFLEDSVGYLLATDPTYIQSIDPYIQILNRMYAAQNKAFDEALESLAEYTYLYMRHQVSFMSSGQYSNTSFEEVFEAVYDNEELMIGTYLPGLFLTQLFWPIHHRVMAIHRERFLEQNKGVERFLEIGVGHGMTLLNGLKALESSRADAFDISRHALSFAATVIDAAGIDRDRCSFHLMDVTKEGVDGIQADLATMGEILEHVEHPEAALENLRSMLKPGASAFITTVIDSNAIDHIYQFRSKDEIDALIQQAGFEIAESQLLHPRDLRLAETPGTDPTQFYYGIATAGS